jgi:hypothetical protein
MPSVSTKQRNFMHVVHAMQKGKMAKSGKAGQAADSMNPSDVKDFLMQECGFMECGPEVKMRILKGLKEIQEPMNLQEEVPPTPNPVASSKTLHGDYEQTLTMYRGFEFLPKENQAIQNFDEVQPAEHDKFKVKYSKSDSSFTNTSTIVVKKLREPTGQFVYIALIKVRGGDKEPEVAPAGGAPGGEPPQQNLAAQTGAKPPEPQLKEAEEGGDEIKIIKSIPLDGREGSEILTNFLQAVYHQQA